MKTLVSLTFVALATVATAQSYTSYFVGDAADVETEPFNRTVLAAGAGDSDAAMISFLSAADEVDGNWGEYPMAIGCEEYTAFTAEIDVWWGSWELPLFKVYGEYPAYDDYAYLIFPNCAYSTGGIRRNTCPRSWSPASR